MSNPPDLATLIASINHPHEALLTEIREEILRADPLICEGVKWNSLSFRTSEWFATWNWRRKDRIEFIFHLGAKAKTDIDLPELLSKSSLLEWKSPDRCIIAFANSTDFGEKREQFQSVVLAWITLVR